MLNCQTWPSPGLPVCLSWSGKVCRQAAVHSEQTGIRWFCLYSAVCAVRVIAESAIIQEFLATTETESVCFLIFVLVLTIGSFLHEKNKWVLKVKVLVLRYILKINVVDICMNLNKVFNSMYMFVQSLELWCYLSGTVLNVALFVWASYVII